VALNGSQLEVVVPASVLVNRTSLEIIRYDGGMCDSTSASNGTTGQFDGVRVHVEPSGCVKAKPENNARLDYGPRSLTLLMDPNQDLDFSACADVLNAPVTDTQNGWTLGHSIGVSVGVVACVVVVAVTVYMWRKRLMRRVATQELRRRMHSREL
jgi:hypothetical protein